MKPIETLAGAFVRFEQDCLPPTRTRELVNMVRVIYYAGAAAVMGQICGSIEGEGEAWAIDGHTMARLHKELRDYSDSIRPKHEADDAF